MGTKEQLAVSGPHQIRQKSSSEVAPSSCQQCLTQNVLFFFFFNKRQFHDTVFVALELGDPSVYLQVLGLKVCDTIIWLQNVFKMAKSLVRTIDAIPNVSKQ